MLCCGSLFVVYLYIFFFNDTATTEIYTLSLHDALPIFPRPTSPLPSPVPSPIAATPVPSGRTLTLDGRPVRQLVVDRKSTRLNSSHANISYAVFCLKKKKKTCIIHSFTSDRWNQYDTP